MQSVTASCKSRKPSEAQAAVLCLSESGVSCTVKRCDLVRVLQVQMNYCHLSKHSNTERTVRFGPCWTKQCMEGNRRLHSKKAYSVLWNIQNIAGRNLNAQPDVTPEDTESCRLRMWHLHLNISNKPSHHLVSCSGMDQGVSSWHIVNQSGWGNLMPDLRLEAIPALSHQDAVTTCVQQRALSAYGLCVYRGFLYSTVFQSEGKLNASSKEWITGW